MRHVDFTPFYRSTVGFDRLFDLLGTGSEADAAAYPPYKRATKMLIPYIV